jgi:hypothetical protein
MKDLKNIDTKRCTVCEIKFDIEKEGGVQGFFGIIPVTFCDYCFDCVLNLAEHVNPNNKLT